MPNEKIRVEAEVRGQGLTPLINQLGQAEKAAERFQRAAGGGSVGGLGGGARGVRGARSAGGIGGELAGGLLGGGGRAGVDMFRQLGMALGVGMAFGIGFSVRNAMQFGAQQITGAAGLGVAPSTISGYNERLTGWGGLSNRLAYKKEVIGQSMLALAGQSDMGLAQREALFSKTGAADTAYSIFRARGIDPMVGMGAEARFLKTFNLGPDSVDTIAKAFARGADISRLARAEDFVQISKGIAGEMAGFKGTIAGTIGLTAAIQSGVNRAYRGEPAANLQRSMMQLVSGWMTGRGSSYSATTRALMGEAVGFGPRGATEMGMDRATAAVMARFMSAGAALPEYQRPWFYSQRLGMEDHQAFMLSELSGSPETLKRLRSIAAGRGTLGNLDSFLADEMKRLGDVMSTPEMRASAFTTSAENTGYQLGRDALGMFSGELGNATRALATYAALTWAMTGFQGARGMGSVFGGGLGGAARGAASAGAGALSGWWRAGALRGAAASTVDEVGLHAITGGVTTQRTVWGAWYSGMAQGTRTVTNTARTWVTAGMAARGFGASLLRLTPVIGVAVTVFDALMGSWRKWEAELDKATRDLQDDMQNDTPGGGNRARVHVGWDKEGNPIYEQPGDTSDNYPRVSWWHDKTGMYPQGEAVDKMRRLMVEQDLKAAEAGDEPLTKSDEMRLQRNKRMRDLGYTRDPDTGEWQDPAPGTKTRFQREREMSMTVNDNKQVTIIVQGAGDPERVAKAVQKSILDLDAKEEARKYYEAENVDRADAYEPEAPPLDDFSYERNQQ